VRPPSRQRPVLVMPMLVMQRLPVPTVRPVSMRVMQWLAVLET
jgi:hypothetical protein